MLIKYIMECEHCGEEFVAQAVCDLTQDGGESVEIFIDTVGGFEVTCPKCGCVHYIPQLYDYIESYEDEMEDEEDE